MVTAKEARQISNKYKDSFDYQIKEIAALIHRATEEGKFYITYMSYDNNIKIRDYMISLGYQIEFESNNRVNIKW